MRPSLARLLVAGLLFAATTAVRAGAWEDLVDTAYAYTQAHGYASLGGFTLHNYAEAWRRGEFTKHFMNSLIIVIPVVVRTTENMLILIPNSLREAAFALGTPKWIVIRSVTLKAARAGVITGVLLALARIAGETAPLLFTSFNNRFFTTDLRQPISTLTVQVFTYAISPYEDWHRQAWAGALVLVSIVLVCSLLARLATRRLERMHAGN